MSIIQELIAVDALGPYGAYRAHNRLTISDVAGHPLAELLTEPTIKNLYIGNHPTYWIEPGIPHDGYLGEFLMHTKAVIRD
jgi:hypothetical protein